MARRQSVIVDARIDRDEFRRFMRDLKRLSPESRKAFVSEMKGLAGDMVTSAQRQASWSKRIPGAIKPQVTARRVGLRVQRTRAPHGRPFEGITSTGKRGGEFRHPVFGNRDVWVTQKARPFLLPAVDEHRDEFLDKAGDAVDKAARKTGWK